eukprot:7375604-Pyramimonas_sp.AAC.1
MVQGSPETPQDRSQPPKIASRRPTRPPRRPKSTLRGLPKKSQEAECFDVPLALVFDGCSPSRLLSFPTLQRGPRGPQDRSKTAQ